MQLFKSLLLCPCLNCCTQFHKLDESRKKYSCFQFIFIRKAQSLANTYSLVANSIEIDKKTRTKVTRNSRDTSRFHCMHQIWELWMFVFNGQIKCVHNQRHVRKYFLSIFIFSPFNFLHDCIISVTILIEFIAKQLNALWL